ncbi:hypothetical protein ACIBH1_45360 [Nonomuraea sp. NPDC050663]|uniref:hypothetical protein n=1 Tax=Nonomuraea sp. NPDC050663 TaxID=3364370 RepID=UPI0037998A41
MSELPTIAYTGSRDADRDRVRADLALLHKRNGDFHLIVGYDPERRQPRGGDRHAHEYAVEHGLTVECWPALWQVPELAKTAGLYRNGLMLGLAMARQIDGGRVGVLAHLKDGSTGSAGTAAYAAALGLPVWRRPAGRPE